MKTGAVMARDIEAALKRYVNGRMPTGAFLYAVLCNDLYQAVAHADLDNARALSAIATYVEGHLPVACRGSRLAVARWLAHQETRCRECDCPWPCHNCVDAGPITPDGLSL